MIDVPKQDLALLMEAGYIYLAMGKFNEAKQVFEGVVALAPKSEVPVVALSNVLFAQSKFLAAIRLLKDALKINPDSSFALAHLGEALLFHGKKEEAVSTLSKACAVKTPGKAVNFAKSLLVAIEKGFDPVKKS